MNNTTRIIIAGIFGYTAYRISKELSSAFIAVKAINCGIMLEATKMKRKIIDIFKKLFNIHSPSAMYHENLYRKESH